jgi:energy-coupling factor transporter ATP-binding protein EcfA2
MEYRLNEFDPSTTKEHRIWLIIGPRGSGKSALLTDILFHTRNNYDIGVAFTATTSTVDTFKQFLPHSLIYKNGYDYDKGEQILRCAKDHTERGRQKNTLIVLDDCMFDSKVMKANAMTEVHLNGRHSSITLFNTTQYVMSTIPPIVRTNVDYVLVLQDSVLTNRKRLFEYFFGNFPNFKEFDTVMQQVTAHHGCLVLDKTQTSPKVSDAVFYYKAKTDLPRFRIGKPGYFRLDKIIQEDKKKQDLELAGNQQVVTIT